MNEGKFYIYEITDVTFGDLNDMDTYEKIKHYGLTFANSYEEAIGKVANWCGETARSVKFKVIDSDVISISQEIYNELEDYLV